MTCQGQPKEERILAAHARQG